MPHRILRIAGLPTFGLGLGACAGDSTSVTFETFRAHCRELRHIGVGAFWGDAAAEVSRATPTRISLYRKAVKDPACLKSKKILIWCFTARKFTEGTGWNTKVPVVI